MEGISGHFSGISDVAKTHHIYEVTPKNIKVKNTGNLELLILQINLTLIPLTMIDTNILTNFRSSQSEMWEKLI